MNRRKFFKTGTLTAVGTTFLNPLEIFASQPEKIIDYKNKKAKNIIMMISDGMSSGTLNMGNLYSSRILGRTSNWMNLYENDLVSRGLMDMASASSIVTDSAAASSSWGGGIRVKNGSINTAPNGEQIMPIWQKFKKAGKKAGIVTTVTATHATPAGFTVSIKSRNDQSKIAEEYLRLEYDVIMGGGNAYFDPAYRKDKQDLYQSFAKKGYALAKNRTELLNASPNKRILGIFSEDALPYQIDRLNNSQFQKNIPTLAEMTQKAIDAMKNHPEGFVLQVESGKVDWAAHANDIAGLIHEQLQFDEAIKTAIDFANQNNDTLVIITTDHGNANPGMIYGKYANDHFDSIAKYNQTNENLLNWIKPSTSQADLTEYIYQNLGFTIEIDKAKYLLQYYNGLEKSEEGLYNYKKLPYKSFADIQQKFNSVGWISMDHSADYVEIAMYGPGKELLKPFIKNTDLHYMMLESAEVENIF